MTVLFGNVECIDPRPLARWAAEHNAAHPDNAVPAPWLGRANSFRCPLGQTAGVGWILLLKSDLDKLGLATSRDLRFKGSDRSTGQKWDVTLQNLLPIRALCCSPGRRGDEDAVYWVELADRRRLAKATAIDKAYNLRDAPGSTTYFSATKNGGSAWTWATLTQDVWDTVGLLGTWPGLPFTPDGTPDGFDFYGWYAYDALGFILSRLCCALRLDPVADTFSIVRLSAADTATQVALLEHDNERLWDSEPVEAVRAVVPEFVRVLFAKSRAAADTTGGSRWYIVDEEDPDGAQVGVEAGTYAILYDDLPAIYNSAGTLQNQTALEDRAAERAEDYFRRARHERIHRVFTGAVRDEALRLGSLVQAMLWSDHGDGLKTELLSVPWLPGPGLLAGSTATGGGGGSGGGGGGYAGGYGVDCCEGVRSGDLYQSWYGVNQLSEWSSFHGGDLTLMNFAQLVNLLQAYFANYLGGTNSLTVVGTGAVLTALPQWHLVKTYTADDLSDADMSQDVPSGFSVPAKAALHNSLIRTKTVGSGGGVGSLQYELLLAGSTVTTPLGDGLLANDITCQGHYVGNNPSSKLVLDWTAGSTIGVRFTSDVNLDTITGGEWEVYLLLSKLD